MGETARSLGHYWVPPDDGDELARQADLAGQTRANTLVVPGRSLARIPADLLDARGVRLIADWSVFVGEEWQQRFPDSVPVDAAGQPYARDGWYVPVCPNHPQVRAAHLDDLARLLEGHGDRLSGLWLDFIRYPVRWEGATPPLPQLCFCRHCLDLFLGESLGESLGEVRARYTPEETRRHAQAILSERRAEWVEWKCRRIAAFAQDVRRLIDERGLDLRLGCFTLPWRQADFGGALRAVAGQDLGLLAGTVDVFSPMVYHRLCAQDVAWIAPVIGDVQAQTGRAVLPIVQAMDRPDPLPPQELEAALAACLANGAAGVLVFTLGDLQASAAKVAAVRRTFDRYASLPT